MTVHNRDIAQMFDEIADLLELQDANPFRVRAYRTASLNIKDHPRELSDMLKEGINPEIIPGIGEDLAKKIHEAVRTGKMRYLEWTKEKVSPALIEMLKIPGLGPKKIQELHKKLKIDSLADLKKALEKQSVRTIPGFSEKTEDLIREGLSKIDSSGDRFRRVDVETYVNDLVRYLEKIPDVSQITVCGSYRRLAETVGDIDIVVTGRSTANIIHEFTHYALAIKILAEGTTRASIRLKNGLQIDLRAVPNKSYGAAVHYFSGSKSHVVQIREMAVKKGLKINEYGVFKDGKSIAGTTEASVYTTLGLPFIPPELRENRGEIEAAKSQKLPKLVELKDLQGDLHTHTKATDGKNSLEEMAEAAKKFGLEYIANTDHSQRVTTSQGFNVNRLRKQVHQIDELNKKLNGITILKGIEVDILEDGSLDLPDYILNQLDIVVASIHTHFKLSREKQTKRLLKAIDNRCVTIVGHMTGRLINERPGYDIDIETIMKAVKNRGCFLELDSDPARLDIDDIHCKMAKEMGILIAINSNAHSIHGYKNLTYGIGQARRGWLEKDDVLNTRSLSELKSLLDGTR